MELLRNLFEGNPALWGGGVAHSVLILSLVIALGIVLGKVKIGGVSIGVTWILFVGILFGHFNFTLNDHLMHFVKEFGLILFVYSIGLQVGPSFFSAFKKGGLTLNLLACSSVLLSVIVAVTLHFITQVPITTMVGVLSGAVTNTPGLGAAQQANSDLNGVDVPEIAMGYAVAYPLGVVGTILVLLLLRYIFRVDSEKEEKEAEKILGNHSEITTKPLSLEVCNEALNNMKIMNIKRLVNRKFVISHIIKRGENQISLAHSDTLIHQGDKILVITSPENIQAIIAFFGKEVEMEWEHLNKELVSKRIIITRSHLNGKTLAQLNIRKNLKVSFTHINRSGVELIASPGLELQIGDRVTVVGNRLAVEHVEKVLGNSIKQLDHPNLIPIFIGIALGCILGSIPILVPGMPQPVKLGLAGGPLIVSILISRFGPHYKLVTYTTMSANLMIREIGISLFLACVGLGAGKGFIDTVFNQGGYVWVFYGALITIIPLLVVGCIARYFCKLNYFTIIGVLSGGNTNPPALAYASEQTSSDTPGVGYATVYPMAMFLRVLTAQLLILLFA